MGKQYLNEYFVFIIVINSYMSYEHAAKLQATEGVKQRSSKFAETKNRLNFSECESKTNIITENSINEINFV